MNLRHHNVAILRLLRQSSMIYAFKFGQGRFQPELTASHFRYKIVQLNIPENMKYWNQYVDGLYSMQNTFGTYAHYGISRDSPWTHKRAHTHRPS